MDGTLENVENSPSSFVDLFEETTVKIEYDPDVELKTEQSNDASNNTCERLTNIQCFKVVWPKIAPKIPPAYSHYSTSGNRSKELFRQFDTCTVCYKHFSDESALDLHRATQHSTPKEDNRHGFLCKDCNRLFPNKTSLDHHTATKHLTFRCDACEKTFRCAGNFKRHMSVHNGLEPCNICHKIFPDRCSLDVHRAKPDAHAKFQCERCPYFSFRRHDLIQHSDTHSVKDFICKTCGKTYRSARHLKRHQALHRGVSRCYICTKHFPDKQSLIKHRNDEHVEPLFKCEHCDKSFNSRQNLKRHKKAH